MRVLILTSDKTSWALQAWRWLADKYWPEHPSVLVGGFTKPQFLSDSEFVYLGEFFDYPIGRWSDAFSRFLRMVDDECFIWSMDDFWFIQRVKHDAVVQLFNHATAHKELARIDLSNDRAGAGDAIDLGKLGNLDVVGCPLPTQYNCSLQAGIWRRSALLQYLVPGETAWQVELNGTGRMNAAGANVIGTRQEPMRYLISIQKGVLKLDGGYQGKEHALPQDDVEELRRLGYI